MILKLDRVPPPQNKTNKTEQNTGRTIWVINIDAEIPNKRSANHIHKYIKRIMVSYNKVQFIPTLQHNKYNK
jgi:hypothetical protein